MSGNRGGRWPAMLAVVLGAGCATAPGTGGRMAEELYGRLSGGEPVHIYTLRNRQGAEARICNYGGIVVSLKVPDRQDQMGNVVLGYDSLADYERSNPYFGCLVGRYGNRIAHGRFTLDGQTYQLATNNGPNHLHGGIKGFDKVVWKARPFQGPQGPALELGYVSKDGEEGYPGRLDVTAVYTLTEDNALRLDFTARTDKPTICNLTHHSYFNLRGAGRSSILDHEVMIHADRFTPVDSGLIPTGELRPVQGTPFDFRAPMAIGARIGQKDEQLAFAKGYDHNWILNKSKAGELSLAARVEEPVSGRIMEVWTTEPGLQFYVENFLGGPSVDKDGAPCQARIAFCMEPQHFPDSPNRPEFPSAVLRPGDTYKNTIIYKFTVKH